MAGRQRLPTNSKEHYYLTEKGIVPCIEAVLVSTACDLTCVVSQQRPRLIKPVMIQVSWKHFKMVNYGALQYAVQCSAVLTSPTSRVQLSALYAQRHR